MISVTIITYNAERHLHRVLFALRRFDEIILLDSHSSDRTLEIARQYPNVQCHTATFQGFGAAHNYAASLAHYDWILSIDADEVVTESLVEEIWSTTLDPNWTYAIRFCNFFRNQWIRFCGWYPDRHVRLYQRQHTSFSQDAVHERILSSPDRIHLFRHPILHYSYESISDFLVKMERYSTLFASQNQGKRRSSLMTAVLHSMGAFVKTYILKLGFLDGEAGFIISSYNAHVAFYKYLKLAETHAHHAHVPSRRPEGQICDATLPLFEDHLAFLQEHAIGWPGDPLHIGSTTYCLTFDDAFYDFYHLVYPLLQKYRIRALLAVPAGYILEDTSRVPEERLAIPYHLAMQEGIYEEKAPFCTWKELREMSQSGWVQLASHSYWHANLTFPFVKRHKEIIESKQWIEEQTGQTIQTFVYPFGRWNPAVDREVAQHYRYRFRIGEGVNFSWGHSPLLRICADRTPIQKLLSLGQRMRYIGKGIGTTLIRWGCHTIR